MTTISVCSADHLNSAVAKPFTGHSTISIFVKTMRRTIVFSVRADTQIYHLKSLIQDMEGTPPEQIALVYAAKVLYNQRTLRDYMVPQDATIHMLIPARWGGRLYGG